MKTEDKQTIDERIIHYLNGESNEAEKKELLAWLKESDQNQETFIRMKKVWIASNPTVEKEITFTFHTVKNKLQETILLPASRKKNRRTLIYTAVSSAAAAILVLLAIQWGNGYLNYDPDKCYTIHTPAGERGQMTLTDGTRIWLNSGTDLFLGENFNRTERRVKLEGEAFFEVAKDKKRQFIVESGPVDIVVHGTSFNICSYPDRELIEVTLKEGQVSIHNHHSGDLLAELQPNQQVGIRMSDLSLETRQIPIDRAVSWTFEELIFDHTNLDEVYAKMESWYGVKIHLTLPPDNMTYRFRIKSESLIEILQLINKITPITYQINGKEVNITYQ